MVMRQHTSGMPALPTAWSCDLDWVPSCVCSNNLNIVSMCALSPVVHTSNVSSYVCNHGEHYETPYICDQTNSI